MTRVALVAFVDVLFAILYIFFLMPHQTAVAEADETTSPGVIAVELQWPAGDIDVDLWVQAPGNVPVGYSNKGSPSFNLLRDDLGEMADDTDANIEYSFSRGAPAGEWIVNVHLYRAFAVVPATPVVCSIRITMLKGNDLISVFRGQVTLSHVGEEITVHRFTLDEGGKVTSTSKIPMGLRSQW